MTSRGGSACAKNPRALAGRLRRAQTFLRTLGIEVAFSREGRTGTRIIRMSTSTEDTVSTVSIFSARGNGRAAIKPSLLGSENKQQSADDAGGADVNAAFVRGSRERKPEPVQIPRPGIEQWG